MAAKNRVAETLEIINSVNLDKILNRLKTLTPREHEVLNQVVSGRLNKRNCYRIRNYRRHRQGPPQDHNGENGNQVSR